MSQINKIQVECNHCHCQFPFQMWESVNVTLQPYMKKSVLYGDIFRTECPNCHQQAVVEYPIIYHDMEKRIMVSCNSSFENQEFRSFTKFMSAGLPNDYTIRLASAIVDFVEKVTILDCGYDDRLMEILKLFVIRELISEGLPQEMDVRFSASEAEGEYFLILLSNDMAGHVPFSKDMYQVVKNVYQDILEENEDSYIDSDWAVNFLKEHQNIIE